jgi:hypothetical protein
VTKRRIKFSFGGVGRFTGKRRESRASRIKDFLLGFPHQNKESRSGSLFFHTLWPFLFSADLSGKQKRPLLFSAPLRLEAALRRA